MRPAACAPSRTEKRCAEYEHHARVAHRPNRTEPLWMRRAGEGDGILKGTRLTQASRRQSAVQARGLPDGSKAGALAPIGSVGPPRSKHDCSRTLH